jgi:RHH-type transcriptional regulator, proline utilization regulon repressor / proline dehydrogenase / delta 1-pyrroline-5-carboxylate dehydrogenase
MTQSLASHAVFPAHAPLREAIADATRRPEPDCMGPLIAEATLDPEQSELADATALDLATRLRARGPAAGVEAMLQAFSLDSREGIALMCLAEALLRIPDAATRDALIRDQIGRNTWTLPSGHDRPMIVNAAAWGMALTGRMTGGGNASMRGALMNIAGRGGAPLIRRSVDAAIRTMGRQFVIGETMGQALKAARAREAQGFTYSYDMLGEAALTANDAIQFRNAYMGALEALAPQAARHGALHERPGLSIKLSALHPRYSRAQRDRVMSELLPTLRMLALRAQALGVGLNIDAEESERLDLSLDLLEALCDMPELAGWDGIGFVVQAYGKRAHAVIAFLIALARRTERRIAVRLVKGAYWDSEIKRAQVEGQNDFPVFTRKCHTDVSYVACARQMLNATDALYPQFATHNARTIATIHALAGPDFTPGLFEFQCLHGMGETVYEPVISPAGLARPCRIYAPVGPHETLLSYLVRRLLENGANSSFVNQANDRDVSIETLIADPLERARAIMPPHSANPGILRPPALFTRDPFAPVRTNARGIDLADEATLDAVANVAHSMTGLFHAGPMLGNADGMAALSATPLPGPAHTVRNPADKGDRVGDVVFARSEDIDAALSIARDAAPGWSGRSPSARAEVLERAADLLEADAYSMFALLAREAGKTLPNAVAEVREAVDFLRYYAAGIRVRFDNATYVPLGTIACISPWNFPLAIFTGQIAAALAAGNVVLAKPAEETPLVAARMTALLHEAGVPQDALQLLPGEGDVGAALIGDARVDGVMFTGSTSVALSIARILQERTGRDSRPIPLIAETGGQNAMVVDSSALPEQVVSDVIASAFDSAGQRCSALRVLCVQEDCAERVLEMLRGAMRELRVGDPRRLETDIGPVISGEAQARIEAHIADMRRAGRRIWQAELPEDGSRGHFVPPTLIEIGRVADIGGEVFGPVLHVRRFKRAEFDGVIDAVNATGYGLTFGVHSRIESTIQRAVARSGAGNVYVNRNMIGATVGVQPFGGSGLSGTGPKAGGPLTLGRLLTRSPVYAPPVPGHIPHAARALVTFLESRDPVAARRARIDIAHALPGTTFELPGPVGETNTYALRPRGAILCAAESWGAILQAVAMVLGTGNTALVLAPDTALEWMARMPASLNAAIQKVDPGALPDCAAMLMQPSSALAQAAAATLTAREGRVVPLHHIGTVRPEELLEERVVTVNTTAAGGNAALMSMA